MGGIQELYSDFFNSANNKELNQPQCPFNNDRNKNSIAKAHEGADNDVFGGHLVQAVAHLVIAQNGFGGH